MEKEREKTIELIMERLHKATQEQLEGVLIYLIHLLM